MLDPDVIGMDLAFETFDLSLGKRRDTKNQIVHEAAAAMKRTGLGLKAATITPETRGDVGSPNAILRRAIDGKVIVRTGRRLPGIRPIGGIHSPISIVRMAVGDAYGATEWRERIGDDEVAFRTERIERSVCRVVAEYAFSHARKTRSKVFGGPKYTVSPVYEGMLKEEMDDAAARYPEVTYEPQLIDATYALLISSAGDPMVIPSLNRDGDCLSDLVMQLFGSIAGAESVLLSFRRETAARVRDGGSAARHGAAAVRQERREPDGDDSRRSRVALARRRFARDERVARDLRIGARDGPRRRGHERSRRPRFDDRIHEHRHRQGAGQTGHLGDALNESAAPASIERAGVDDPRRPRRPVLRCASRRDTPRAPAPTCPDARTSPRADIGSVRHRSRRSAHARTWFPHRRKLPFSS